MPIERRTDRSAGIALGVTLALAALLALAPGWVSAAAAQQQPPAPEPPAGPRDNEPQAPTGAREVPRVPDQEQRPGEPPPTIETEAPDVDQVEEEKELGSFFLTTFSLASAYDELS